MSGFDPAAATAAYLASIPPAVRQAAAIHTAEAHGLAEFHLLAVLVACAVILIGGALPRVRDGLVARGVAPWVADWAAVHLFAGMVLLGWATGDVIWSWSSIDAGAAPPTPYGLWYAAVVLGVPALAGLAQLFPRRWWAWGGAAFTGLAMLIVWGPFLARSGPAGLPPVPAGTVRDGLVRLVQDTGLKASDIYLSPDRIVDADVTGAPGRPRVVITQGLLDQASPAQARASVGHLIGHYVHLDQLWLALTIGVLGLGCAYAVHRLFRPVVRWLGRDALAPGDPAGLPVAVAVAAVYLALAGVAYNGVIRAINVRADQYSLDHAREPDGLAQSLLAAGRNDKADPSLIEELVYYDHPSLKSRIAHAMRWKADHG